MQLQENETSAPPEPATPPREMTPDLPPPPTTRRQAANQGRGYGDRVIGVRVHGRVRRTARPPA